MTYVVSRMNNIERVHIGQVGVDSGQLMIMDPCYVDSQVNNYGNKTLGMAFWGEGEEEVESLLEAEGIWVEKQSGRYKVHTKEPKLTLEVIKEKIMQHSKDINKIVVVSPFTDSFYDAVCDATESHLRAGEIPYKLGHPGLAVAFSSGIGDGSYNVYATYADIPDWGRRICKIEIEMITDTDFEEDEDFCEECGEDFEDCDCLLKRDGDDENDEEEE